MNFKSDAYKVLSSKNRIFSDSQILHGQPRMRVLILSKLVYMGFCFLPTHYATKVLRIQKALGKHDALKGRKVGVSQVAERRNHSCTQ